MSSTDSHLWQLSLFGHPQLIGPSASLSRLDRRTAALLAHVAVRGSTSRARMASLLWPDSPEPTARANLRQLLHRLRQTAGASLLDEADGLGLASSVRCDVAELEANLRRGAVAASGALEGTFLQDVRLDECQELMSWIEAERLRLDELRRDACEQEAARLEREGAVWGALEWNRRVLAYDPVREEAFRREMRLLAAQGDRAGALRAYDRCRLALRRELEAEPSEETTLLAQQLERGALGAADRPPTSPSLPRAGACSMRLVGREAAWERLESAWASRFAAFVCGEAGSGKTRLLNEFLQSRGQRGLTVHARPTDSSIPFGSLTRLWRALLSLRLDARLPPWALRELARFLPELGEPPPQEEPVRLIEAQLELLRQAAHHLAYLMFDDLHDTDVYSFKALAYLLARLREEDSHLPVPRLFYSLRDSEAPAEVLARLTQIVQGGLAVRIQLPALAVGDVAQLIEEQGVWTGEQVGALARSLLRFTGGNPLFVLETLDSLRESRSAGSTAVPDRLQVPGKVETLLLARIERLTPEALQLARALAITEDDFSLGLAAGLLDASATALAVHWQELVRAQLVGERWFTHDLLHEVVLKHIPPPVRVWMHRRTAELLVESGGVPERIGRHWFEAGEAERAAWWRQRAMHGLLRYQGGPVSSAVEEVTASGGAHLTLN